MICSVFSWFCKGLVKRGGLVPAKEEKARLLMGRDTRNRVCCLLLVLSSCFTCWTEARQLLQLWLKRLVHMKLWKYPWTSTTAWRPRKPWGCPLYFPDLFVCLHFTLSVYLQLVGPVISPVKASDSKHKNWSFVLFAEGSMSTFHPVFRINFLQMESIATFFLHNFSGCF